MHFSTFVVAALSCPHFINGNSNVSPSGTDDFVEESQADPSWVLSSDNGESFYYSTMENHLLGSLLYGAEVDDFAFDSKGMELRNTHYETNIIQRSAGVNMDMSIDLGVLRELDGNSNECVSRPIVNQTGELLASDFRDLVFFCNGGHRNNIHCPGEYNVGLGCWNTSYITDMSYTFLNCGHFNDDISMWDTGKVTDMSHMFHDAYAFNSDLSAWETGKVTDFSFMFYRARMFDSDLSSWQTGNVTDMSNMFHRALTFNSDLSLWETWKVTDMSSMFSYAWSFNSDVSSWQSGKVTDMRSMFFWALEFNSDVSSWQTSNVTNMIYMFSGARKFNSDVSSWQTGKVTDMEDMFWGARSFNSDVSSWQTDKVTGMAHMFVSARSFNSDVSSWQTGEVTDMSSMFWGARSFNSDVSSWQTGKVTDMTYMFKNAWSFNSDVSSWQTGNVTGMYCMFQNAHSFTSDVSSWQTGEVTDMDSMFKNAHSFNSDVSSWNVGKVEHMGDMFENAWSFNSDVSAWQTGKVTVMSFMFRNATSFNSNVSSWNVGKVKRMKGMFEDARNFNQCLRSWAVRTGDVTTKSMFEGSGCPNQSDPDPQKGPWCQGFDDSCFGLCSDAEKFRFGKDNEQSCASINDITASTEEKLENKLRRICKKLAFPTASNTTKQTKIRVKHVCREACGRYGFGPGKRCDFPAPVPPPTNAPTISPTVAPITPTAAPSVAPTIAPTASPNDAPVPPTPAPIAGPPVVLQAIESVALKGGLEFTDPNSYQSRALARTEEVPGINDLSRPKIIQYYVLYSIFMATNSVSNFITESEEIIDVPSWMVSRGWNSTSDPCTGYWFGVECDGDQVTGLNMFNNMLTGAFPPEVTLLASDGPRSTGAGALELLDVFGNELLTNNGDNSWWVDLGSGFRRLFFRSTAFTGSLGRLPDNIAEFDCSLTLISGGLTNENFQGLNSLVYAELSGNVFNAPVPSAFTQMQSLELLYLEDSSISGDLSHMVGMNSLREHWIDRNPGLGGTIPPQIGNIASLQSLSITSCSLSGTIPPELGKIEGIMQFWVYDNNLTGTIPMELGYWADIEVLQVEGNSVTGVMPQSVCDRLSFPQRLKTLGADCFDPNFRCDCCTCCSVQECPG